MSHMRHYEDIKHSMTYVHICRYLYVQPKSVAHTHSEHESQSYFRSIGCVQ